MKSAQPMLEEAIERGEAPAHQRAYLVDRIRTLQGQQPLGSIPWVAALTAKEQNTLNEADRARRARD